VCIERIIYNCWAVYMTSLSCLYVAVLLAVLWAITGVVVSTHEGCRLELAARMLCQ
jgi:hypothetical protein